MCWCSVLHKLACTLLVCRAELCRLAASGPDQVCLCGHCLLVQVSEEDAATISALLAAPTATMAGEVSTQRLVGVEEAV